MVYRKRYNNYRKKIVYGKIRHGKTFRTRKGKLGCYKYVNGRKVAFVLK